VSPAVALDGARKTVAYGTWHDDHTAQAAASGMKTAILAQRP